MKLSNWASKNLASFMSEHNIIEAEKKEIYSYCFDFILDLLFFNVSILLIGFILKEPWLSIIYIITMTPTKMMAGGAHANSRGMCSIISYAIAIVSIIFASNISSIVANSWIEMPIFFIFLISIVSFAPIDTPNKRLNPLNRKHLKKCCFLYSLILGIIYLFFFYFIAGYTIMTVCVIIIAINQYIGILINKHSVYK